MNDSSQDLKKIARNVWLVGLGTVATLEKEAKVAVEQLDDVKEQVKKHSSYLSDSITNEVSRQSEALEYTIKKTVDSKVSEALNSIGYPSKGQVEKLSKRIDSLLKRIEDRT